MISLKDRKGLLLRRAKEWKSAEHKYCYQELVNESNSTRLGVSSNVKVNLKGNKQVV